MPNTPKTGPAASAPRLRSIFPWLAGVALLLFVGVAVSGPLTSDSASTLFAPEGGDSAVAAVAVASPTPPQAAPVVHPPSGDPEEGPALDPRVDPSLAMPAVRSEPPGFPPADRFSSISDACVQLTKEHAPAKYSRAVYDYCEHRSWGSSRNNIIESRVDKTQIHDRDRPFAWRFYNRGIITGTIDPSNCLHHEIDSGVPHPRSEKKLANEWPFGRPKMTAALRGQWFDHHHDMERFGTRGPHDNNFATAVYWIPGCYPPEVLDRNDVNATITVLRSIAICESYGCPNKHAIRKRWRNGPSRKWKKEKRQG